MGKRTRWTILTAALVLGSAVAFLVGCEDSDLLAPGDGLMVVTALPQTVVIDQFCVGGTCSISGNSCVITSDCDPRGRSVIEAVILDANNVPIEGVTVTFSPQAGSLRDNVCVSGNCSDSGAICDLDEDCPLPSSVPVKQDTDADGSASVVLVVDAFDPQSVTVNVSSGGLSGSGTVTNPLAVDTDPPVASLVISPNSPVSGPPEQLDATASTPYDELQCIQYTISSSIPIELPSVPCSTGSPQCTVIQGRPGEVGVVDLLYSSEQRLSVTLRVTDNPEVPCARSGPASPGPFSSLIDSVTNYIICNNTAPNAVLTCPDFTNGVCPGSLTLNAGVATLSVSAAGSSDLETPNSLSYDWNCGNGQTSTAQSVNCSYNVTDQGTTRTISVRVLDPGNGQAPCSLSDTATTSVTIN